jgi:hypothetical protein
MQLKCSNGIRDWGLKQQLRLGSKGSVNKTFRQALMMEIVKLAVRSSIRIPKMSVKTPWRSQPPPKQKKSLPTAGGREM